MKILLFFLTFILLAGHAFGQQNNTINTNSNSSEEIRIAVPVPQNMPEMKKAEESQSASKKSKSKAPSLKEMEQSNFASFGNKFSSTKKIAATQTTSRSPSMAQQKEMNDVIQYYKANAPESFEYHYFTYAAGNYNVSLISHLQKAKVLRPANSDVIVQLAAYNTIVGNKAEANKNLKKLVEINRLTSDVLAYDADVLNSVSANGYLLTHGFDDGLGAMYMNSVKNTRSDVKIISLDFMQSKYYRDSLKKEGFVMPVSTTIDVAFLSDFCKKNESKNLFLSMTFPKPYFTGMVNELSVHGLVFAYGKNRTGILEENEIIWKKLLKSGFVYQVQTEKGKQLSSNYLPMLFYLRDNYERKGQTTELLEIDKAIDKIGIQSNKTSKVNSMRGKK